MNSLVGWMRLKSQLFREWRESGDGDNSINGFLYGLSYRLIMKIAHHYGWHYAPDKEMANGDKYRWCQWCGFRQTFYVVPEQEVESGLEVTKAL